LQHPARDTKHAARVEDLASAVAAPIAADAGIHRTYPMHIEPEALRRWYASLETSQLLQLREQGKLREDAAAMLAQELACRSDDAAELAAIHHQLAVVRDIAAQASPERRLLARLVDLALVLPPAAVAFVWMLKTEHEPHAAAWLLLAIANVVFWALDALFAGRSPGKRACRIHIVRDADRGQRPGRGALLLRNLLPALVTLPMVLFLQWMDRPEGLPFGLFAFALAAVEANRTQTDRRFGDRLAGTVVVGR
jgi:uncharacterized RDD family membrane protein YckC